MHVTAVQQCERTLSIEKNNPLFFSKAPDWSLLADLVTWQQTRQHGAAMAEGDERQGGCIWTESTSLSINKLMNCHATLLFMCRIKC